MITDDDMLLQSTFIALFITGPFLLPPPPCSEGDGGTFIALFITGSFLLPPTPLQ